MNTVYFTLSHPTQQLTTLEVFCCVFSPADVGAAIKGRHTKREAINRDEAVTLVAIGETFLLKPLKMEVKNGMACIQNMYIAPL